MITMKAYQELLTRLFYVNFEHCSCYSYILLIGRRIIWRVVTDENKVTIVTGPKPDHKQLPIYRPTALC
jgi:hypothetical protein